MIPEDFTITSDFATIKNDGVFALQFSIPSGTTVPGSGSYVRQVNQVIGRSGSNLRALGNSSRNSTWYAANQVAHQRTGTISGSSTSYTLYTEVYRSSPDSISLSVSVFNNYPSTLTLQSGTETITFYVSTFLSPFI